MTQTIIASIVVLGVLIVIHELGHFLTAKRFGVFVHEFSVGMGPGLVSMVRGETTYRLRVLPLGGFVRLAGTDGEEAPPGRGFNDKTLFQRMSIIVSGPAMNFMLTIFLCTIIFSATDFGFLTLNIAEVMPDSPAEVAGLEPGDRVVSINDRDVFEWHELVQAIERSPGEALRLSVKRQGEVRHLEVTPELGERGVGIIGISSVVESKRLSVPAAFREAVQYTVDLVVMVLRSLGMMIMGRTQTDFIGVVGIGQLIGEASRLGIVHLASLAAGLSAYLGLFNLLPVPALDGSRLLFLGFEGIRGRPVDPDKENMIHFIGFALLIGLALFINFRELLGLVGIGG